MFGDSCLFQDCSEQSDSSVYVRVIVDRRQARPRDEQNEGERDAAGRRSNLKRKQNPFGLPNFAKSESSEWHVEPRQRHIVAQTRDALPYYNPLVCKILAVLNFIFIANCSEVKRNIKFENFCHGKSSAATAGDRRRQQPGTTLLPVSWLTWSRTRASNITPPTLRRTNSQTPSHTPRTKRMVSPTMARTRQRRRMQQRSLH